MARKKSRAGKCFGFLRYAEVRNPVSFERLLNDIPVGRFKVKVNIARFFRQNTTMEKLVCPDSSGKEGKSFHEKPFLKKVYKAGSGKSFAEVLKSNHIEQGTHEISLSSTPKMLS